MLTRYNYYNWCLWSAFQLSFVPALWCNESFPVSVSQGDSRYIWIPLIFDTVSGLLVNLTFLLLRRRRASVLCLPHTWREPRRGFSLVEIKRRQVQTPHRDKHLCCECGKARGNVNVVGFCWKLVFRFIFIFFRFPSRDLEHSLNQNFPQQVFWYMKFMWHKLQQTECHPQWCLQVNDASVAQNKKKIIPYWNLC